jgi:hypothetical protein
MHNARLLLYIFHHAPIKKNRPSIRKQSKPFVSFLASGFDFVTSVVLAHVSVHEALRILRRRGLRSRGGGNEISRRRCSEGITLCVHVSEAKSTTTSPWHADSDDQQSVDSDFWWK